MDFNQDQAPEMVLLLLNTLASLDAYQQCPTQYAGRSLATHYSRSPILVKAEDSMSSAGTAQALVAKIEALIRQHENRLRSTGCLTFSVAEMRAPQWLDWSKIKKVSHELEQVSPGVFKLSTLENGADLVPTALLPMEAMSALFEQTQLTARCCFTQQTISVDSFGVCIADRLADSPVRKNFYRMSGTSGALSRLQKQPDWGPQIAILHSGAPRLWLVIPKHGVQAFELALFRQEIPGEFRCPSCLMRDQIFLSPAQLCEWDAPFTIQVQRPGEIVAIEPGSYFMSFDPGQNVVRTIAAYETTPTDDHGLPWEECETCTISTEAWGILGIESSPTPEEILPESGGESPRAARDLPPMASDYSTSTLQDNSPSDEARIELRTKSLQPTVEDCISPLSPPTNSIHTEQMSSLSFLEDKSVNIGPDKHSPNGTGRTHRDRVSSVTNHDGVSLNSINPRAAASFPLIYLSSGSAESASENRGSRPLQLRVPSREITQLTEQELDISSSSTNSELIAEQINFDGQPQARRKIRNQMTTQEFLESHLPAAWLEHKRVNMFSAHLYILAYFVGHRSALAEVKDIRKGWRSSPRRFDTVREYAVDVQQRHLSKKLPSRLHLFGLAEKHERYSSSSSKPDTDGALSKGIKVNKEAEQQMTGQGPDNKQKPGPNKKRKAKEQIQKECYPSEESELDVKALEPLIKKGKRYLHLWELCSIHPTMLPDDSPFQGVDLLSSDYEKVKSADYASLKAIMDELRKEYPYRTQSSIDSLLEPVSQIAIDFIQPRELHNYSTDEKLKYLSHSVTVSA